MPAFEDDETITEEDVWSYFMDELRTKAVEAHQLGLTEDDSDVLKLVSTAFRVLDPKVVSFKFFFLWGIVPLTSGYECVRE